MLFGGPVRAQTIMWRVLHSPTVRTEAMRAATARTLTNRCNRRLVQPHPVCHQRGQFSAPTCWGRRHRADRGAIVPVSRRALSATTASAQQEAQWEASKAGKVRSQRFPKTEAEDPSNRKNSGDSKKPDSSNKSAAKILKWQQLAKARSSEEKLAELMFSAKPPLDCNRNLLYTMVEKLADDPNEAVAVLQAMFKVRLRMMSENPIPGIVTATCLQKGGHRYLQAYVNTLTRIGHANVAASMIEDLQNTLDEGERAKSDRLLYHVWRIVVDSCVAHNDHSGVIRSLDAMGDAGFNFTVWSMHRMIEAYSALGDIDGFTRNFRGLVRDGYICEEHLFSAAIKQLSGAGQVHMAEAVFDEAVALFGSPVPSSLYGFMIAAYSKVGDFTSAMQLYADMDAAGYEVHLSTIVHLIRAFAIAGDVSGAQRAFDHATIMGIEHSVVSYTALLSAFSTAGDTASAENLIETMRMRNHTESAPNLRTMSELAKAYQVAGDAPGVHSVLKRALVCSHDDRYSLMDSSEGFRGNVDNVIFMTRCALRAYREAADWQGVKALWSDFIDENLLFAQLSYAKGRRAAPKRERRGARLMPPAHMVWRDGQWWVSPDAGCYVYLLHAHAVLGEAAELMDVLRRIIACGFRLRDDTFKNLAKVLADDGDVTTAVDVLQLMDSRSHLHQVALMQQPFVDGVGSSDESRDARSKKIEASTNLSDVSASPFVTAGDTDDVLSGRLSAEQPQTGRVADEGLNEMDKNANTIMPSRKHEVRKGFSNLILNYCEVGDIEGAMAVQKDMELRGHVASEYVIGILMDNLADRECYDQIVELLPHISLMGKDHSNHCKKLMRKAVHIFIQKGCMDLAEGAVARMLALGYTPAMSSVVKMISMYGQNAQPERAVAMLRQIQAEGIQPCTICYTTAIGAVGRSGDCSQAQELFDEMASKGVPQNIRTYNSLVLAYATANNPAGAARAFSESVVRSASWQDMCNSDKGKVLVQWAGALIDGKKEDGFAAAEAVLRSVDIEGIFKRRHPNVKAETYEQIHKLVTGFVSAGRPGCVYDIIRAAPPLVDNGEVVSKAIMHSAFLIHKKALRELLRMSMYEEAEGVLRLILEQGLVGTWTKWNESMTMSRGNGNAIVAGDRPGSRNPGITPQKAIWFLIHGYGEAGRVARIVALLDNAREHNLTPNASSYVRAIVACADAGDAATMRVLQQKMTKAHGDGWVGLPECQTLINAYVQADDFEAAHAVFNDMKAKGIAVDASSLHDFVLPVSRQAVASSRSSTQARPQGKIVAKVSTYRTASSLYGFKGAATTDAAAASAAGSRTESAVDSGAGHRQSS